MTIKELLVHQQQTDHVCLLRQGLFFRGYARTAAVLHRAMGYVVKRRIAKSGDELLYAGFPSAVIDRVLETLATDGAEVVVKTENYIELQGVICDYSCEELRQNASESGSKPKRRKMIKPENGMSDAILREIRNFDLSQSTPLESMNLIGRLQRELMCAERQ